MKKSNKKNLLIKEKKNNKVMFSGNDDTNEIKSFTIIVIVIMALIGVIYGATELLNKKDTEEKETTTEGKINYNKLAIGNILNAPYSEYYVLIYNSEDSNALLYSTLMTKYMEKSNNKDYIKIYYCDLANKLNSDYYNVGNDNKSNPNVEKVSDFDLGDLTLIKVSKGKIVSYIENYDKIVDKLK